jgi:class 3 adenylate cyclase/TolB-like protein
MARSNRAAMNPPPVTDLVSAELRRSRKAVVVVDMVESVRLMQAHELDVIDRWRRFIKEIEAEVLSARGGRLVKSLGDGLLIEFEFAPSAAAAAIDIQHRIGAYNAARPADARIQLRVAVHVSDVVVDSLDIYGQGVNLAARLATLAAPGEIVVSDEVRDLLVPGVDPEIEDLGECFVKHVDGGLRAYRLGPALSPSAIEPLQARLDGDLLRPGVAVIPFECAFGQDPGGTLGEALADETISQLARSPDLHVISGLSTRSLKGRAIGVHEIATYLGAAYIVSGRYRFDLSRVRLHVELAEASSQRVIWAQSYDTTPQAAFDPESSVADKIVSEVSRVILERELELALSAPFPTLEAYTLLFGAVTLMHRASLRQFDRAREMLEHLAHRQGRRGVAHAWLAKWHVLRVVQGWSTDRDAEGREALARAERALEANPQNALALSIAGLVHGYLRKDLAQAGRLYVDARSANPSEPLAWLFSATWHAYRGEGREAVTAAETALRLSPLDPMRYFFDSLASTAMLSTGDWERSIQLGERSIRANRLHASTWRTLAFAHAMRGRLDDARRAVEELRAIEPGFTVGRFLERFPGRDGPLAQPWAQALKAAGLPD